MALLHSKTEGAPPSRSCRAAPLCPNEENPTILDDADQLAFRFNQLADSCRNNTLIIRNEDARFALLLISIRHGASFYDSRQMSAP